MREEKFLAITPSKAAAPSPNHDDGRGVCTIGYVA
jgi:hypothetical protein